MNKLHDLQKLFEICATEICIMQTAKTQFDNDHAEENFSIAFKHIIKILKSTNDSNHPNGIQGTCLAQTESNKEEKVYY